MKNFVTTLLGLAFVILGCNIANVMGYSPPTNLQTVAASTVPQPMDHFYDQVKNTKPDTVYQDKIVHDTVPCNHKPQPVKTVVKTKIIEKKGISSLPLLYIATPVEGDDVAYTYNVHKLGE